MADSDARSDSPEPYYPSYTIYHTDEKIECCECSEYDCFEHDGNPDDALCRHCAHRQCSDCGHVLIHRESTRGALVQGRESVSLPQAEHGHTRQKSPATLDKIKEFGKVEEIHFVPKDPDATPCRIELEDSDLSDDNDSTFSSGSLPDTMTSVSEVEGINALLVHSFTALFYQDEEIISLLLVAVSKENIGIEGTRREFRRLLKRCAEGLKIETQNEQQKAAARFIRSFPTNIMREIFSRLPIDSQETLFQDLKAIKITQDSREKVEEYLRRMPVLTKRYSIRPSDPPEDSDQDSMDEESSDDEQPCGSLKHIDQIEGFILGSVAYQCLRHRLLDFVYPSLRSKLGDLLRRWSKPQNKYHRHISDYNLFDLTAELQHINPHTIQFHKDERMNRTYDAVRQCQNLVERWTREHWDWWPLRPFPRPLAEEEVRLVWKCACGEDRWAEIPSPFERRLRKIISNLPQSNIPMRDTKPLSAVDYKNPNMSASDQDVAGSSQPSRNDQLYGASSSSSANKIQAGQGHRSRNGMDNPFRHLVLFVVKRGTDYKLAQIGVSGLSCHTFFSNMREQYFHLRGSLRNWSSIWRYSHCDFYMCEKFDDYEFTPKQKNMFPEATNHDYEYQPKPMDNIPPVAEHEFRKRFYACHSPRPAFHWYHKCKRLGCHSYDILQLFPKKKTRLEEAGDDRQIFWGIYARERISFVWVLGYNLICVLPMLAFFMAGILPQGYGTDLQNPSVPLAIMLGMLSLFWSMFISSLQFEKPH